MKNSQLKYNRPLAIFILCAVILLSVFADVLYSSYSMKQNVITAYNSQDSGGTSPSEAVRQYLTGAKVLRNFGKSLGVDDTAFSESISVADQSEDDPMQLSLCWSNVTSTADEYYKTILRTISLTEEQKENVLTCYVEMKECEDILYACGNYRQAAESFNSESDTLLMKLNPLCQDKAVVFSDVADTLAELQAQQNTSSSQNNTDSWYGNDFPFDFGFGYGDYDNYDNGEYFPSVFGIFGSFLSLGFIGIIICLVLLFIVVFVGIRILKAIFGAFTGRYR